MVALEVLSHGVIELLRNWVGILKLSRSAFSITQ